MQDIVSAATFIGAMALLFFGAKVLRYLHFILLTLEEIRGRRE